jgi:hypothetical protein
MGTSRCGDTPDPSTAAPLHMNQAAAGNRRTKPDPTEKFPPPSKRGSRARPVSSIADDRQG